VGKSYRKRLRERNERKLPNESFLQFQQRVRKAQKKVKSATSTKVLPVSDEA